MGNVDLPYVEKNKAKGRLYLRYRRGGLRLSLPSDPTSPEFTAAYRRIHEGFEKKKDVDFVAPDSITALIVAFKQSTDFGDLKPRVKELYRHNLDQLQKKLGKFPAKNLTKKVLLEWRDQLADNPAKANNLMAVISRLYSFGIDREVVQRNPLLGVKRLKIGEWRPWTAQEIETFLASAGEPMRLALSLGLYTGQRLGDVIKMRWDQIADGGIYVVQQKTGAKVWVPLHRDLETLLAETPRKAETVLTSATGQPFKADHFKHQFKDATRKAGLPDDLVFHGLRKTAAVRLAEAGCTTEQIKAITGHRTDDMAAYYARQANQKVLAKAAMGKMEGN